MTLILCICIGLVASHYFHKYFYCSDAGFPFTHMWTKWRDRENAGLKYKDKQCYFCHEKRYQPNAD